MNATCPVCAAPQDLGLVCHSCTTLIEKDLAEVRALMGELDVTISKQDRVPSGGGGPSSDAGKREDRGLSALAHTRSPVNFGAIAAADVLTNVLTTWARDVGGESAAWLKVAPDAASASARALLSLIDAIRRHPAADELFDEITDAIRQARRAIDRPQDRQYLGQCMVPTPDDQGRPVTCLAELFARVNASEVSCPVCGAEHEVGERRAWLLQRAQDAILSIKDASLLIGEVGGIKVSQASIRSYVHRGKLAYRAPVEAKRFRLGDLLAVVLDESERKGAA